MGELVASTGFASAEARVAAKARLQSLADQAEVIGLSPAQEAERAQLEQALARHSDTFSVSSEQARELLDEMSAELTLLVGQSAPEALCGKTMAEVGIDALSRLSLTVVRETSAMMSNSPEAQPHFGFEAAMTLSKLLLDTIIPAFLLRKSVIEGQASADETKELANG